MVNDTKEESKTLFSAVIPKKNQAGTRDTGSYRVELKSFNENVFVQITQTKYAYGQTPSKTSWITLSPTDKDVLKAIADAIKEAK